MACSCGSGNANSSTPQNYVVTTPNGERKTYSSEVEAAAAAQRQGGTYRAA